MLETPAVFSFGETRKVFPGGVGRLHHCASVVGSDMYQGLCYTMTLLKDSCSSLLLQHCCLILIPTSHK